MSRRSIYLACVLMCYAAPVFAQFNAMQQAAIAALPSKRAVYSRLPSWQELSADQQRLVTTPATCPAGVGSTCWQQLSEDARAVFFMVTYTLEKTLVGGAPLIRHVKAVEGVLVPSPAKHHHSLTNVTHTVDGWRIHLILDGLSVQSLADWHKERGKAHQTHAAFDYTVSFRDFRERDRRDGPFLQLVLNAAGSSSDSDLDRGAIMHLSSPRDVYPRFRRRYVGIQRVLVIS